MSRMRRSTRQHNLFRALTALVCGALLASWTTTAWSQNARPAAVGQGERPAELGQNEPVSIEQQLNDLMGLRDSELRTIDVDAAPGEAFITQILHHGELLTLDAWPVSVRAGHYQLLVQVDDGSIVSEMPGPERTYRGDIIEWPGAEVAASLSDHGMYAMIMKRDGERVWVEPVARKLPNAPEGLHVIYRDSDRLVTDGSCGTFVDAIPPLEDPAAGARGSACGTGLCFAELANDADFEYFQDWGSVSAVENRINSVVNAMNVQYENDVDITHVISAIVVRTSEPDPYSATDSFSLVNQVRLEWENNLDDVPRDLTQLFTGKNVDGSVIGRAFDIGVVCSGEAYSFSQSDCCGSFARTVELHAHECGHVWNGIHCNCPGFTMHTPLNQSPLGEFTSGNITRISSHRDAVGCLGTAAGLDLPFFDDFSLSTIDGTKWTLVQGANVETGGVGEPSPPNSLNIDGSDVITSNFIDLEPIAGSPGTILLNYWWQRTGNDNSPEGGEDLFVEYLNDQNQWITVNQHPGNGPDNDPFQEETIILPSDSRHSFFRIRFRGTSPNPGADDWFVDDVGVVGVIPQDDNDFCGVPVDVVDGESRSISTVNASTDGFGESGCGGAIENDIWYRFVATCSGDVTVSICDADFDARLAIYFISCPSGPDEAIACDDNSCAGGEAEVTFNATTGFTYWIRIGAANPGVEGTATLNLNCAGPETGACCMPDGSCSVLSSADCANASGTYQGDGTDCGGASCPQPEGACCMPDGSCVIQTSADCSNAGGTYQGDGTDCGGASCPQPCTGDISDPADGAVDVFDLFVLLNGWGMDGPGADLAAPNNIIDVFDLFELLGAWGACP